VLTRRAIAETPKNSEVEMLRGSMENSSDVDVRLWLQRHEMGNLKKVFLKARINGQALSVLTAEDLENIGVPLGESLLLISLRDSTKSRKLVEGEGGEYVRASFSSRLWAFLLSFTVPTLVVSLIESITGTPLVVGFFLCNFCSQVLFGLFSPGQDFGKYLLGLYIVDADNRLASFKICLLRYLLQNNCGLNAIPWMSALAGVISLAHIGCWIRYGDPLYDKLLGTTVCYKKDSNRYFTRTEL